MTVLWQMSLKETVLGDFFFLSLRTCLERISNIFQNIFGVICKAKSNGLTILPFNAKACSLTFLHLVTFRFQKLLLHRELKVVIKIQIDPAIPCGSSFSIGWNGQWDALELKRPIKNSRIIFELFVEVQHRMSSVRPINLIPCWTHIIWWYGPFYISPKASIILFKKLVTTQTNSTKSQKNDEI